MLKCLHLKDEGEYSGGSGQKLFRCELLDIRMGANATLCLSCAHYISTEWATENQEDSINQNKAQIVINALQQGIPPQFGILQLVFGRDEQKKIVERHLEMVSNGNSRFLVVSGAYGTGKTHLLQFVLETSLLDDFVASKIALKTECNFKDQITVYSELMRFLIIPDKRGGDAIDWIARRVGRKNSYHAVFQKT